MSTRIQPPLTLLASLPSVHALAIQVVSLFLVALFLYGLKIGGGFQITLFLAAALQGTIAAVITYLRHLPPWWLLIQFLFPLGLISMLGLQLPPILFLVGFLILLSLYWAAVITRVPLYLSGPAVWRSVADLLPRDRPISFVDIGSGLGGAVIHLARQRPESTFTGIELAPLPWLVSWIRAYVKSSQARFIRGNFSTLDFSQYDVVFAYLSPLVMDSLWAKACAEMSVGTLLLSYEFPVSGVAPDMVIHPKSGNSILYGWRM